MSPEEELSKIMKEHGGMITSSMANGILEKRKASASAKASISEILAGKFNEGDLLSLECTVHRILGTKIFKKDGREGFRRSVVLLDGSESIPVTLWNKQAGMVERLSIERGDRVLLEGLRLRKGLYGYELSSTNATYLARLEPSKSHLADFSALSGKERGIDIIGSVTAIGTIRHFTSLSGREGSVSEATITDGEREIRLTLWGPASQYVASMRLNDQIKIEFTDIKQGPNGIEVSAGENSRVLIIRGVKPTPLAGGI